MSCHEERNCAFVCVYSTSTSFLFNRKRQRVRGCRACPAGRSFFISSFTESSSIWTGHSSDRYKNKQNQKKVQERGRTGSPSPFRSDTFSHCYFSSFQFPLVHSHSFTAGQYVHQISVILLFSEETLSFPSPSIDGEEEHL